MVPAFAAWGSGVVIGWKRVGDCWGADAEKRVYQVSSTSTVTRSFIRSPLVEVRARS